MKIKDFLEAVREFTDYANESKSGTGWIFAHGVAGPTILFKAGPTRHRRVFDPFHAVLDGWSAVHDEDGWSRVPDRKEVCENLELSAKAYGLLQQAIYAVTDHKGKPIYNKRLRRDLIEACGLTEEEEQAQKEWSKIRAQYRKAGVSA